MALGKYSRVDSRKSANNYCSTVTLVAFVALCLVGVWMMTTSSVVPLQNLDTTNENKDDVKTVVSESNAINENTSTTDSSTATNESNSKQFEDNPGDLPEDATKGDSNVNSHQDTNNPVDNTKENTQVTETTSDTEENREEKGTNPEDGSKTETETETANKNEKVDTESKTEKGDPKDGDGNDSARQENNDDSSEKKDGDNSQVEKQKEESKAEEIRNNGDGNESAKQENVEDNNSKVEKQKEESKAGETRSDADNTQAEKQTKESKEDKVDASTNEILPSGAQSELLNETSAQKGSFSTQATESKNEKEGHKSAEADKDTGSNWKVCNVTAGSDYIPCLDNLKAIKSLPSTKHYEHRERHCPENPPTCLVPLPEGYQRPIEWPTSREKIWYHNVPHTKLAKVKGHQNWVKVSGEFLTFPGGGTQFKHGALHYIDFIQQIVPDIAWGKRSRVILDVGCGVASFGGFLFDRDVLTMSFAPKDEHEAQVQFALERGIPGISAVMGTQRLPFPARVFDVVHCARCRVPWHIEGGKLLLELNRLLRPGGFFVWSATPIYQKLPEDAEIWDAMKKLTKSMCWEVKSVSKDKVNGVGVAVYQKPTTNECYEGRSKNEPPLCKESDDPNAAWKVPLQACMHKVPTGESERGSQWPEQWPSRVAKPPYWLLPSQVGVYGKAAPEDFSADFEHWKRVVTKSYMSGLGINWSAVRNVMDMRAIYGGFAAALKEMNVWVMNVVSVDSPDTLPIIFERGLFGMYHDWCESFSTYPRSYDLLHADHLFSKTKKKCNLVAVIAEVDRMLRPEGKLIVRDNVETINEMENILRSMHWEVRLTYSKDKEGLLCVQKTIWRPKEVETIPYAIDG